MRLLYIPVVTHTVWATESEILLFRRLAQILHEQEGVKSWMVIPHGLKLGGFVKEPWIDYLKLGKWKRFHVAMGEVPPGLNDHVSMGAPDVYVDAVITTRTGAAGAIQRSLWNGKGNFLPVFVKEEMAADYSVPTVKQTDAIDLQARTLSYSICQGNFFGTAFEKRSAMTAARRFLKASVVDVIDKKSIVGPTGVNFDLVGQVRKRMAKRKKHAKFTLFFGGRLNVIKRAEQLLKTYDKFYAAGRPIRIIITSPLTGIPKGIAVPAEVEVHADMNTEEFLGKCCRSHVLLASSVIEGYTVGLLEQMATGIVTVLPELPWAKALLKEKWEKYPFKYKTFGDAYAILKWIYDNYAEACKRVAWVPKYLEENEDEVECCLRIYDRVKTVVEAGWPPKKLGKAHAPNSNCELVRSHLEKMPKKFYLFDLLRSIVRGDDNSYTEKVWHLGSRGKMTAWDIYSYLSGLVELEDVGGSKPCYRWKK